MVRKSVNFQKLILFLVNNTIWIFILISILIFSILTPSFFTIGNLTGTLYRWAALGLLVIGQSLTLLTGNFDLSSESAMGVTAILAALLMVTKENGGWGVEMPFYIVIPIMLAVGMLIGFINGLLITKLKMNTLIVTIAMQLILRGVCYGITPGSSINRLPKGFIWLGGGQLTKIVIDGKTTVIYVASLFIIVAFVISFIFTRYRKLGRNIYSIGSNKNAAEAAGINTDQTILAVYIISGLCAALAGLLDAGRLDSITPKTGQNLTFPVQAAAVIGGISLSGGRGTLIGAFGGVILWGLLDSGLSLMEVSPFWIDIARGALLILAMIIDAAKVMYFNKISLMKLIEKSSVGLADRMIGSR